MVARALILANGPACQSAGAFTSGIRGLRAITTILNFTLIIAAGAMTVFRIARRPRGINPVAGGGVVGGVSAFGLQEIFGNFVPGFNHPSNVRHALAIR